MSFFLKTDIEEIAIRLEPELDEIRDKTIFFAGIAGFLGRYFAEVVNYLNIYYEANIKVIGADNFVSSGVLGDYVENYYQDWFKFIEADLTKLDSINLQDEKLDIVVHAAGIASPAQYKLRPIETFDVAINGSKTLIQLAIENNARYSYFSSSEIYGDPDSKNIPIKEEYKGYVSCMGPRACYDESKRASETLAYIYNEYHDLHTNIIRPFNVYGPGMQKTDYRVMPNFAFNAKENLPLEVYGAGNQTRTYCYITDAIVGFCKVILRGKSGEAYNIGNPSPEIAVEDLATIFAKVSNNEVKILKKDYPENYPADEPSRRCPSIQKATDDLSYFPEVDIEDGIKRFLSWTEKL